MYTVFERLARADRESRISHWSQEWKIKNSEAATYWCCLETTLHPIENRVVKKKRASAHLRQRRFRALSRAQHTLFGGPFAASLKEKKNADISPYSEKKNEKNGCTFCRQTIFSGGCCDL